METVTESPTKSAPPETQEALTLLAQGKRHLLVKDVHEAVSCLAKSCELLAAHYGERANECGDAYLYYGRALLDLARCETGVLGDALGDEDAEDSSDEDNDEETVANGKEEEEEKDSENGKADSEKKDDAVENEKKEESEEAKPSVSHTVEDTTETKEAASSSAAVEAVEGTSGCESTKKEEDDEEEDDVSNLKLAWEMLELAKLIFQRQQDNKQFALKLADVYLLLGEVSLESETYSQAVEDMKSCLEIQLKHLESDDRRIAETHYQLGTAYSLNNQFDESVEEYSKSIDLVELKIKNLEAKLAAGDKPDESDAFYTVEGEIKELGELLPEIREKVTEMKEVKIQALNAMSKMMEEGVDSLQEKNVSPKAAEASVAKPVSNISHLVRKKRKADEEDAADAAPGVAEVAEDGKGTKCPVEEQPAKMRKAE